jgi:hypothetical protein
MTATLPGQIRSGIEQVATGQADRFAKIFIASREISFVRFNKIKKQTRFATR